MDKQSNTFRLTLSTSHIYISKVMNEIMGLHQTIFGTDIKTCTWPVDNVQRSVQRQYNPVALTTRSR